MTAVADAEADTRPANPYAREYASFLHQTKDHVLTVHQDEGLNRQMRVGRPGDSNWSWHITTWAGHLATTGDIAAGFIFSRLEDMILFFDSDQRGPSMYSDDSPNIDLQYWGEKLLRDHRGIREYSADVFIEYVTDLLEEDENLGLEAERIHQKIERVAETVCLRNGVQFEAYVHALRTLGRDNQYRGMEIDENDPEEVEYFGEPLPELSPAFRRSLLIEDARRHSETDHEAREWLQDHQDEMGSDSYWESDLSRFTSEFVYAALAIELTVRLWREYEKTPEAIARREAPAAPALSATPDQLKAVLEFAERGYMREFGSIDHRHAYTDEEMASMKARFADHREGAKALSAFISAATTEAVSVAA